MKVMLDISETMIAAAQSQHAATAGDQAQTHLIWLKHRLRDILLTAPQPTAYSHIAAAVMPVNKSANWTIRALIKMATAIANQCAIYNKFQLPQPPSAQALT